MLVFSLLLILSNVHLPIGPGWPCITYTGLGPRGQWLISQTEAGRQGGLYMDGISQEKAGYTRNYT